MSLSGPQRKQLFEAMLSAYSTRSDLELMVQLYLQENLEHISIGANLSADVLKLITWEESRGRTENLISALLADRAENPKILAFAESMGFELPEPQEPTTPPAPEEPATAPPTDTIFAPTETHQDHVYQNFDLHITRSGDRYRAQVQNSPAGQAFHDFDLPFAKEQLKNLFGMAGRVTRGLRLMPSEGEAIQPSLDARTFGEQLYNAVFGGRLETALIRSIDATDNLRIRLILDTQVPELADLPWEYLYSPHLRRFIALSTETVPVRYLQLPLADQGLTAALPLTMLAVISNPQDVMQLNVDKEYQQLQQALGKPIANGLIRLERLVEPTMAALQRRLRQGHIHLIHYIGHGYFDDSADEGGLILENGNQRSHRVSADQLGALLGDHDPLRLIFLNACEGARGDRDDAFAGTAQYLVSQGIPAVVAMQFEVTDTAAITLARGFYEALTDFYPVGAALAEARKAVYFQPSTSNRLPEWGTPVLFMRSDDGRLF